MRTSSTESKASAAEPVQLHVARTSLRDALALPRSGALVSIVGGGGKSALLFALGATLPGRTILTTTTRIFAAQIKRATASVESRTESDPHGLESKLADAPSGLLIVGRVEGEKALGVEPAMPAQWLARNDVDYVVVEADGSRMRPIKAPAAHEPVIAAGTTDVVIAIGIDALGLTISDAAHRPERVQELLGLEEVSVGEHTFTEAEVAKLATHPDGGLKEVPTSCRVVVMLNKVETQVQREQAMSIAEQVLHETRVDRVIVGALEGPEPDTWTLVRRL
jgi:molybdenum cofactor cytidylyltransferase